MCLIVFGYKSHPDYCLVMAANRDEFYGRPTQGAGFWENDPGLLAGKDLRSGGTWLGVHKNGRFSAVTNYRDIPSHNPNAKSRGHLVTNFLQGTENPKSYLESLQDNSDNYNGFNLLTGSMNSLCHYSNQGEKVTVIEPGIHAVSNALLNTPWPKVQKATTVFKALTSDDSLTEENLFEMLTDTDVYPPEMLPQTGLEEQMERAVSASFIQTPEYGTRCSTVLFIGYDGSVSFTERVYTPGTRAPEEINSYGFTFDE